MTPIVAQLRALDCASPGIRQLLTGRGIQGPARIESGARIGAGCVLFPGVHIGAGAILEPGAVAFRDVPEGSILRAPLPLETAGAGEEPALLRIDEHADARGELRVLDLQRHAGFMARRTFSITGMPADAVRAQHAHRKDHQVLQVLVGEMEVLLCRPNAAARIARLDVRTGLRLPPLTWCAMFGFSANAVVVVHAGNSFDPDDVLELEQLEGWGNPAQTP